MPALAAHWAMGLGPICRPRGRGVGPGEHRHDLVLGSQQFFE